MILLSVVVKVVILNNGNYQLLGYKWFQLFGVLFVVFVIKVFGLINEVYVILVNCYFIDVIVIWNVCKVDDVYILGIGKL